MEIKIIEKETQTPLINESELGFGKYFTDHMFVMDYEEGKGWFNARIVPFGSIMLHPASTVLHYGAEIFEGLKVYRTEEGDIRLFRPMENIRRLNASAERMCLPTIDEADALEILETYVRHEDSRPPWHRRGFHRYMRGLLQRCTRRAAFQLYCFSLFLIPHRICGSVRGGVLSAYSCRGGAETGRCPVCHEPA